MRLNGIGGSLIKGFIIAQVILTQVACSNGISISVDEKVPPTFTFVRNLDENNYIPMFYVSEVRRENMNVPYTKQVGDNKIIWQIEPFTGSDGEIRRLPGITYGIVPPRFKQDIPEHGPPPGLVGGVLYEAGGPASLMPKGFMRFIIQGGKIVTVPIPGQRS